MSEKRVRLSTTEGRQRLPDLIQQAYGEKTIFVFHRYGRELAALVPLDMVPDDGLMISLDIPVCRLCACRFPASFADEHCIRPGCPHRSGIAAAKAASLPPPPKE